MRRSLRKAASLIITRGLAALDTHFVPDLLIRHDELGKISTAINEMAQSRRRLEAEVKGSIHTSPCGLKSALLRLASPSRLSMMVLSAGSSSPSENGRSITEKLSPWRLDDCTWESTPYTQHIADGSHVLTGSARTPDGQTGEDSIAIYLNQQGKYDPPARRPVHMPGTRLGPNENGHPWPAQRRRERVTR